MRMNDGLRVVARESRVKDYVLPQKILFTEGKVEGAAGLLEQKELQILIDETDLTLCSGKTSIVFDFGKEIHGGVRLLVYAKSGTSPAFRIRFGESVAECCSDVATSSATNDHSLRDFVVPAVAMSDMEWGSSGFRFLRLDTLGEDSEISIKSVLASFVYRDLERKGSFCCSDPRWNEIYEVAAYTLQLNMQHHLWDGIKRDRLVWMGDMHPETKGIFALFGADACVTDALDFMRDSTPLPRFINTMPTYSLWYLAVLADNYIQNGDLEYVKTHEAYATALIRQFLGYVDEAGNLSLPQYFLDWPTFRKEGAEAGVYALFDFAMQKSETLVKAFGKQMPEIAETRKRLRKDLPDADKKQVVAFRSIAGHADPAVCAERLVRGGAEGFSTFMSYYIARAMFEGGKGREALALMKEYYGGMLDRGATTFWEDFHMDWLEGSSRIDELPKAGEKDLHGDYGDHCYVGFRHSFCHGWACGPVAFLAEYVLGVRVRDVACREIEIRPCLADLDWAKGSYPTPFGIVTVEHRRENGRIVTRASAPEGVRLTVLSQENGNA